MLQLALVESVDHHPSHVAKTGRQDHHYDQQQRKRKRKTYDLEVGNYDHRDEDDLTCCEKAVGRAVIVSEPVIKQGDAKLERSTPALR